MPTGRKRRTFLFVYPAPEVRRPRGRRYRALPRRTYAARFASDDAIPAA